MQLFTHLENVSAVDGRYREQTKVLSACFSEFSVFRFRVQVEVEYFIALYELPLDGLKKADRNAVYKTRDVCTRFSIRDAERIKELEKQTNHDVKAVEYFIKEKFESLGLQDYTQFIHFGLTSQDVNNTAFPLAIKKACESVYLPALDLLLQKLNALAAAWKDIAMLARTHGQVASPTKLGKEIRVFAERLEVQIASLKAVPFTAKFGGATGNFNAHYAAYPDKDWKEFADHFIAGFGLQRQQTTTQIEHYDQLAALFHAMSRINTILLDLCRDLWMYISLNYFGQKIHEDEVGSSTMPHKVNPIDFENAEGNLGLANALFMHLASKLPVSRLQRDLTDSTVIRNTGVPFAHTLIALQSIRKGLDKLRLNPRVLHEDLENNWVVVSEAIQTILRREGFADAYETLKKLTRSNEKITRKRLHDFIEQLQVRDEVKTEMKAISPFNYTGK